MWLLGQQEHILSSRTQAGGSRGPTRGRKRRWVQVRARPLWGWSRMALAGSGRAGGQGAAGGPALDGGGAPSHPAGDAGTEARGPSPSPPRPCPARTRGHCRGRGDSLARPSPAGRPAAAFPRGPNLRATSHNVWEERRPPGPGAGRCAKVHRGCPRRAAHPHSATFPQVGWAPGARAHGGRPSLRSLLPLPEARLYTVLGSSSSRRDKGRGSRSHFHHKPGQAPALGAVLRTGGGKVP